MNDERGKRIESKIDSIQQDVREILITQGKHHVTLEDQAGDLREHIRRTDLLEQQIKPLETKAAMIEGALKLIGILAVLAGIIEGVVALLEYLKHVK